MTPRSGASFQTAQLFVETSVGRRHPERSWQLVDASLRQGLTRAEWKTGKHSGGAVPGGARRLWRIDEANVDHVLMEMVLAPKPHSGLVSKTFLLDMRPSAGPQHWLITSWAPYGVSPAQMELDAAARGDNAVPSHAAPVHRLARSCRWHSSSLIVVVPAVVFASGR